MSELSAYTDEELVELYMAASSLKALHSKPGGLELSRRAYEQRAENYRQEILQRMSKKGVQQ